jgi:hypothetical protein
MKRLLVLAAALSVGTAAIAADSPEIKARAMVKTADGGRVGTIDRIFKDSTGAPVSVQIIYKGRFVVIPATTLSAGEKGLVTTLTATEVNKL